MTTRASSYHFNIMAFIAQLTAIYHRQLANETKATALITATLDRYHIPYAKQRFVTNIPDFKKAELIADGKSIPCIATSMVSGKISDKSHIVSSLISSQRLIDDENINFNPLSDAISRSNHYFAPSVAVAKKHLPAIINAKRVEATVSVRKKQHTSTNILVGNTKNPETVLFCHYDSIGPGAIDNASGTAALLSLIIEKKYLAKNLFVIAGNEELSYDHPVYWGHGYRVFEQRKADVMRQAKTLLVVDSIGNSAPMFNQDPKIVPLGFPIKHMERWRKKIYLVHGDLENLMTVYHSDNDTIEKIKKKHMTQTISSLKAYLSE
jgi:hypothetical protein